jgi:hypothetical protein
MFIPLIIAPTVVGGDAFAAKLKKSNNNNETQIMITLSQFKSQGATVSLQVSVL